MAHVVEGKKKENFPFLFDLIFLFVALVNPVSDDSFICSTNGKNKNSLFFLLLSSVCV